MDSCNALMTASPGAKRLAGCLLSTGGISGRSVIRLGLDRLELVDTEHLEGQLLVERLRPAGAHLAEEILFEADLGGVHPLALRRPTDVPRRNLGLGDEGNARIAEIREADGVPCRLSIGRLAADQALDVARRC